MKRRLLAGLLALIVVMATLPMFALAEDEVAAPEGEAIEAVEAEVDEAAAEIDEAAAEETQALSDELPKETLVEEAKEEEPVKKEEPAKEEPQIKAMAGGTTIKVLHTNDVHCGINNYAKLAGYRDDLVAAGEHVLVVDAGDHVQGETIGVMTKGEEIIKIMNGVGYDVACPGNHEFDYQMPQFIKNVGLANYPYISANFRKADGSAVENITSYKMFEKGGKKIAFVGVSTPETYTKSTPVYFQDDKGNWVYTFSEGEKFYATIQAGIDAAKAAGADVVIGLAHTGMDGSEPDWNSQSIIKNTSGFDAYIDGHSHEAIPGPDYHGTTFTDKNGKQVYYAQTGTKLANIGEMTITIADDGTVSVSDKMIPADSLTNENANVKALIDAANQKVQDYYGEVIGNSEVDLTILDADGNRAVRSNETNLGDFNADAYRFVTGADISLVNGGGVRKDVKKGDVTRNDLVSVNPFGNSLIKVEATGQQILDALEHGVRNYPGENGGFFQVSGITFDVFIHTPTPVVLDDQGMFDHVDESKPRRVANVKIAGEPIDPAKKYTIGGTSYILQQSGDGMAMFKGVEVISEDYPIDSDALLAYMEEELKGKVTAAQYGDPKGSGRINILPATEHFYDADDTPAKVEYKDDGVHVFYQCKGYEVEVDENGKMLGYKLDDNGDPIKCQELIEEVVPYTALDGTVPAKVVVNGDKPEKAATFVFKLDDGTEVKVEGAGDFQIPFKADKPGTYTVKVKQEAGKDAGYTYDAAEYVITLEVTSNEKGELTSTYKLQKDGKDYTGDVIFTNTYKKATTPTSATQAKNTTSASGSNAPKTGDMTNIAFYLTMAVAAGAVALKARKRSSR